MSFFLIVRGPLGAGKSTIARALAQALGAEVVSIDEILELQEWDGGSEALFLAANVVAAERARGLLLRRVPVVVDGNFYWESALQDLAERLPFPHEVFTLKVPLEVCIERDRLRSPSYGEEATREVFEKVARVDRGIPIDGTRGIAHIVQDLRSHLPRSWFVP
jgi:predicted kinase